MPIFKVMLRFLNTEMYEDIEYFNDDENTIETLCISSFKSYVEITSNICTLKRDFLQCKE